MPTNQRTVLVTGCSEGGIGAAVALEYLHHGYHVFVTARQTKRISSILSSRPNVTVIALDVTSMASIKSAVQQVSKVTDKKLDILINNSGVALTAPALDTDLDAARSMFEVNVLGQLAVTQAFMPLLVHSKAAVVVNNSSINGETNLPFSGVYGSSKAAGTILSETMRLELVPLGVRVVTIITGIIESNLHSNEPEQDFSKSIYYAGIADWLNDRKTGRNRPSGMATAEYAKQFFRKVESGASGKVYIGPLTPLFVYLKWWMPSFVWDYFMIQSGPQKGNEKIKAGFKDKLPRMQSSVE